MNAKLIFFSLLLVTVLFSCSLNGEQEASLNTSLNEYVDARNNNRVSMRVRLTYPAAVRYYKKQGDDTFKERFRPENNHEFWQDGTIREVEQKGNVIHVKYEFQAIFESGLELVTSSRNLYAVSVDDGKHWKFLESKEYINDAILPKDKKLIK